MPQDLTTTGRGVTPAGTKDLTGYRWRDRQGQFWPPDMMETRHLFFTLRLIWNHRMPAEAQIRPFKEYRLGKFYTDRYLEASIRALAAELATRDDMEEDWKRDLAWMMDWLSRPQLEGGGRGQEIRPR